MTTGAFAALLALSTGFLDGVATDWDVAQRTRVSSQFHEQDSVSTDGGQLDLDLAGLLTLGTPTLRLDLRYEPTFSAYTPFQDPTRLFEQHGLATATWQLSPLTVTEAEAEARYGDTRLTRMPAATDPIERVPGAFVVRRSTFLASGGAEMQLSTRTMARAHLAYGYDRGVAQDDTVVLPTRHSLRGLAEVAWNVRVLDALGVRLEGELIDTDGGGQVVIARTIATLRHDLGLGRATWAGLGATYTDDVGGSTFGGVAVLGAWHPALVADLVGGSAELRVDTTTDRLTGQPSSDVEARCGLSVPFAGTWRAEGALTGAAYFSGEADGTRIGSGEARLVRVLGERAELAARYSLFVQSAPVPPRDVLSHTFEVSLTFRLNRYADATSAPGRTAPPFGDRMTRPGGMPISFGERTAYPPGGASAPFDEGASRSRTIVPAPSLDERTVPEGSTRSPAP